MTNAEDLIFIGLQEDLFWASNCEGIAFGSLSNNYRWRDEGTAYMQDHKVYSIFDSGASQIEFPETIFEEYIHHVFRETGGGQYSIIDGQVVSECYDSFPALHFMFDKTWLSVEP